MMGGIRGTYCDKCICHIANCSCDRRTPAEPAPASTGRIPVVESANLVTIRTRLKSAAQAGASITLSGLSACALYYAMDTGKPMASDDPAPVAARELDVEAERDQFSQWHLEKFGYKPSDGEAYGHLFDVWLAVRSAAQSTAPVDTGITASATQVSTQQAGDAQKEEKAARDAFRLAWECTLSDVAFYVARHCVDGDHHAEIIMGMTMPKMTFRGAAPSPNHSPVGAKEQDK